MVHSCQFHFRQIQKSNISAFQSPGDNFDFLPTFDFSMPGDLLVPKLHTFNSNFNSNYCLYKSVESFLVEESAYISIAVTLFMIKRDAFFSAVPPLCWPRRDWLDWPAETFNRSNCVGLLISALQHPLAEKLYLSLFVHLSDRPSVPHWWPRLLCPLLV